MAQLGLVWVLRHKTVRQERLSPIGADRAVETKKDFPYRSNTTQNSSPTSLNSTAFPAWRASR